MSANVHHLPGKSEADQAWADYKALCDAQKADERLLENRAHVEARVAAHVRFCELYARECRRENVAALTGGAAA